MRTLLYGLVVGFMLSALRAPLGIDLVQIPGVGAGTAYGYRALALALIACAWWLRREGRVSVGFLASTALGFALDALWLGDAWTPSSAAGLWIAGLLGFAALVVLGRGDMLDESAAEVSDRPSFLQMIGLCAAGAGVAVALESVARHVRLFGGGLAQDDSLSALVLLACTLLGAIAIGWVSASNRLRSISFPAGLAATAAGAFVALKALDGLSSTRGLTHFLATFGLDTSAQGRLAFDAVIAAACFVVPAIVLGAALSGARSKLDLSSALLGAALGLYFVPRLMATPETRSVGELEMFSAQLVPFGCLTAIGGAALALLASASLSTRARWSALAFTLLLCLAPLAVAVTPKLIISPWMVVPPREHLVFDSPEGLVTVEPSDGGLPMATLDRHALTPPTETAVADMDRIKLSVAMVPNAGQKLRVLLIGQHSPVREQAFKDAGVERIDRSAAWFGSMKRIDDALFENRPAPLGDRIAPAEARRRIAAGEYDLVVVEPVPGEAPATNNFSVPANTTLVAWFSPEQWIARKNLGTEVLFSVEGISGPCVGVVLNGARSPLVDGEPPISVPAGEPVRPPLPLARLRMHDTPRFEERENFCNASLTRRLADAARGNPNEDLLRAFALLYAAQGQTSEFESEEERVALPQESLDLFEKTALAHPPTALVRSVWEALARILLGKRAVADIYKYLQPLAQKYPHWVVLEQVLAQADLEALEPEAAVRRLSALIEARTRTDDGAENASGAGANAAAVRQKDLELWYWLGEAQRQAGDHPSAAKSWRRALELQPGNRALKRELAMELVRASDPEGRKMVDELLAQSPDDAELKVFQKPGPYPEPPAGSVLNNAKKPRGKSDGH